MKEQKTIADRIRYKIELLRMNGFSDRVISKVLGVSEDLINEFVIFDADYEVIEG